MKKILIILFMFSFFNKVYATSNERAYDFKFIGIDGNIIKLSNYENKIIVVVNVASRYVVTLHNMRIFSHFGLNMKKKV